QAESRASLVRQAAAQLVLEECCWGRSFELAVRPACLHRFTHVLKALAKKKAGVTKIAKTLKRTPAAVMVKASLLGVSLDTRG
ncbi:hypothetical protein, partial [Bradyrhizobium sp. C9]|uniref:hypothetical protein n=1 Tax=Bradyrhizobium sp. C9 TaxID=142585 RepID=UPI001177BC94